MKQRNPKSVNFQINHCKKVDISKIYQDTDKPTANEIRELVESVQTDMLTIIFNHTKSIKSTQALEIAEELLDAKLVKSTVWVTLPDRSVLEKVMALKHLARYVSGIKGTKAFFRGTQIDLNRFLNALSEIKTCSRHHFKSKENKACWRNINEEGWGCKYINTVKRKLGRITDVNTSTFWYNFGYFCDRGEWQIDKDLIREVIFKEVNMAGIDICPHFNAQIVLNNIASLPDVITVDNIHFKNCYRKDYLGSSLLVIPENIRHIPPMSDEERIELEKANRIKELEYLIGMNKLEGDELKEAKEQLLVLRGRHESYSRSFAMELYPEQGYRYSDN